MPKQSFWKRFLIRLVLQAGLVALPIIGMFWLSPFLTKARSMIGTGIVFSWLVVNIFLVIMLFVQTVSTLIEHFLHRTVPFALKIILCTIVVSFLLFLLLRSMQHAYQAVSSTQKKASEFQTQLADIERKPINLNQIKNQLHIP